MPAINHSIVEDVTLVIPTLGDSVLQGCLDTIAAGTVWPARVVVVDQSGGAAAKWIEPLRHRGLDILHIVCDPRGISAATNRGLEQVTTTYVAITHDDCRVRREWLEALSKRIADAGDAIVTGRVEPEGEGIVLTIKTSDVPATYTGPLLAGDVLFPPNMAFAARLLKRIGWFDEHPSLATAGEDNEWAHRALRAGIAIIYDPSPTVGHLARHTPDDLPGLYRRYARGQGAFYGTWLRRGDLFIARRMARDLLRAPWLLARGLVTGNRQLVAMARGEIAGLLPGIVAGLGNPGVRV